METVVILLGILYVLSFFYLLYIKPDIDKLMEDFENRNK